MLPAGSIREVPAGRGGDTRDAMNACHGNAEPCGDLFVGPFSGPPEQDDDVLAGKHELQLSPCERRRTRHLGQTAATQS